MDLAQIIKKPVITEKSLDQVTGHRYTFLVDQKANKNQVKKAIEKYFNVDVLKVWTIKKKGKRKRTGRKRLFKKLPNYKKAIVQIKSDQKIDIFETRKK